MDITDMLSSAARERPDRVCLVFDDMQLSNSAFDRQVNRAVHALLARQVPAATEPPIVALLLDNALELLQVFLAAARVGWLAAVFDPKWIARTIDLLLEEARPQVLVVQAHYLDRISVLPPETQLVVVGLAPAEAGVPFARWLQPSGETPTVCAVPASLFYLGYTSGTTGTPKGFVRTHDSWIESFDVSNRAFQVGGDARVIAPGPLVHSLALYAAAATLFAGACLYLVRKFDAASLLGLLQRHPISHIYLVPTMLEALFQECQATLDGLLVTTLRTIISSGDKWTPQSKQRAALLFPAAGLYEFYGASELSFVSILDPEGNARHPTSVGRPAEGVSISIRGPDGEETPHGTVGTLYVQSKMLFAGYYRDRDATRQVLQGEWASVGDLAWQDAEGFVYLAGRQKHMIISGGLNMYPEEVERVLLQLPAIDETVVVGLPDRYWGEKVVALIRWKPDAKLDDAALRHFCRQHLPAYKCPQEFRAVDAFPYTHSGKIARNRLYRMLTHEEDSDA